MINTEALKIKRNNMFCYQIAVLFLVEMKALSELSSKRKIHKQRRLTPYITVSYLGRKIDV